MNPESMNLDQDAATQSQTGEAPCVVTSLSSAGRYNNFDRSPPPVKPCKRIHFVRLILDSLTAKYPVSSYTIFRGWSSFLSQKTASKHPVPEDSHTFVDSYIPKVNSACNLSIRSLSN